MSCTTENLILCVLFSVLQLLLAPALHQSPGILTPKRNSFIWPSMWNQGWGSTIEQEKLHCGIILFLRLGKEEKGSQEKRFRKLEKCCIRSYWYCYSTYVYEKHTLLRSLRTTSETFFWRKQKLKFSIHIFISLVPASLFRGCPLNRSNRLVRMNL